MQFSVAFLDEDVPYLEQFLRYTIQHPQDYLHFHFFSSSEEYVLQRKDRVFHAVLCSVQLRDDILQHGYEERYIILCEEEIPASCKELEKIDKYQPASALCRKVLELLWNQEEEKQWIGVKSTEVHSVFSLYPFPAQGAFAFLLASVIAESKKVLYLDFMQFSELAAIEGQNAVSDLSDILFCFGQDRDSIAKKMAVSVLHEDSLDYFLPLSDPRHLSELPSQLCADLITEIRNTGKYDAIVVGMDCLFPGAFEMLALSHCIYYPHRESSRPRARKTAFIRMFAGNEELAERICPIPFKQELEEKLELLSIEECRVSESGDILRKLIQGGL